MVWKKEGVLFGLAILSALFFNLNAVDAGVLCADNQIILRLSSATNAHGEVWNGSGNYTTEICYDRVFGVVGNGNRICSGTNKVVGLSSLTNAHAESPGQSSYPIGVCYGNVTCVERVGTCAAGENLTLTLSSSTNAHLSNSSSYNTSVCCSLTGIPPPQPSCTLTSASWSKNQTSQGQIVNLNVGAANCSGQTISFVVKERDGFGGIDDNVVTNPVNAVVNNGLAVSNWTAEYQPDNGWPESDPPEYYFTATVISTGTNRQSSNELNVYETPPLICQDIVTCSDYADQQSCEDDLCTVAVNSVPSHVDCDAPGTSCFCAWNITTSVCEGAYKTNEPPPGPGDIGTCYYGQDTSDTCQDDGFLTVSWLTRWEWASSNPGHSDPQGQQAQCTADNGLQDTLPCPAQIPLPFFGFYNLLAALVLVAVVYFVLHLRKGKKKR